MFRRTRLPLTSLLLLAVLLGVPVLLTWLAVRQERLDRALIATVKEKKADAVVLLLKEGADPNAREHSEQPVTVWRTFQNFFSRLRHKNAPQKQGNTALLIAVQYWYKQPKVHNVSFGIPANPRIVQALLDAGAKPNCRDPFGQTPLMFAVQSCPSQVQHLLDKGADVNAEAADHFTPLRLAVQDISSDARTDTLRLLLDRGAHINDRTYDGETALLLAATEGNQDKVRLLLEHGADVSVTDEQGRNVLMWMVQGFAPISASERALLTHNIDLVLSKGVNVNAQDKDGETTLWDAIYNPAMIALLLKRGPVPTPKTRGDIRHYGLPKTGVHLLDTARQASGLPLSRCSSGQERGSSHNFATPNLSCLELAAPLGRLRCPVRRAGVCSTTYRGTAHRPDRLHTG